MAKKIIRAINPDVRKVPSKQKQKEFKSGGVTFIQVSSSNLKGFYYDDSSNTLTVVFNSKRTYEYYKVPKSKVVGLLNATSKGVYFGKNIRYKYLFKEIFK